MAEFKLSAVLAGHQDDVRAVAFPRPAFALTASRDGSVLRWHSREDSTPPSFDSTPSSTTTEFVNAVAFVPPSESFPLGLIVSGGKETIIDVRSPDKIAAYNSDALLLGHTGNICALAVTKSGSHIISGSWDNTARIWTVGDWEKSPVVLDEHQGSVWAISTVVVDGQEMVVTGCADKSIRVFDLTGKRHLILPGSSDVVRSLCPLPSGNSYGGHFASAGNDGLIHIWNVARSEPVATLRGHTGFVYSLDVLPSGEIVSSSEDRTARVWSGTECIQTITHPAISVWSISVCPTSGDIITGSSDNIARIFTRDPARAAAADVAEAFNQANRAFAVPGQTVGDGKINKEALPGPEFLDNKSGTKEGQVQMIRQDNGSVTAYQWSMMSRSWVEIGTVVDSVGSSGRKTEYQGVEYDFVFDVDIEDGKPPLKLPYNLSDNPYDAARRFLERNELPASYYDTTAKFIMDNTKAFSIGQDEQSVGAGAWGSESRPADEAVKARDESKTEPKLPAYTFLANPEAKVPPIKKKVLELNSKLEDGQGRFGGDDVAEFEKLCSQLETIVRIDRTFTIPDFSDKSRDLILRMAASWPRDQRFPVLDIIRILVVFWFELAGPVSVAGCEKPSLLSFLIDSDSPAFVFGDDAPTANVLMGLRTIGNLFVSPDGKPGLEANFEQVIEVIKPQVALPTTDESGDAAVVEPKTHKAQMLAHNRDIALATVFYNYSVMFTSGWDQEADSTPANRIMTMVSLLVDLVKRLTHTPHPGPAPEPSTTGTTTGTTTTTTTQPDEKPIDKALDRAVAALGTVLLGSEPAFIELAYDAFNFQELADEIAKMGKDHERIRVSLDEIKAGLDAWTKNRAVE